jgi:hypothetical protein
MRGEVESQLRWALARATGFGPSQTGSNEVALRLAHRAATASVARSKEANTAELRGLESAPSLIDAGVVALIQPELRGGLFVAETRW